MTDEEFPKYRPRLIELYYAGFTSEQAVKKVLAEEKDAGDRYVSMFRKGMTRDEVANVTNSDDRDRVVRAEVHDVDPRDRAKIEAAVAYGAKELRIATPKVASSSRRALISAVPATRAGPKSGSAPICRGTRWGKSPCMSSST